MPTEQRFRRAFRVAMLLIALVGAGVSFYLGQRLHRLRQESQSLSEQVGYLEISDDSRIHIAAIPDTEGVVPPGLEAVHVWRFRLYLPANYSPFFMTRSQAVSADSPRSRGGGGSSWGQRKQESAEMEINISLLKTDTGWLLSRKTAGSSGASSLSSNLSFDSLDDFIVEPAATLESGAQSFSVDEAICLLRVRGTEAVEPRGDELPLYPGFVLYMADANYRDAMDQWAQGKIDRLPEKTQDEF